MKIDLFDTTENHYELFGLTEWRKEKELYYFYKNNKVVAVFEASKIIGFEIS